MKISLTFGVLAAVLVAVVSANDDGGAYAGGNNNEGSVSGFLNNPFKSGFLTSNGKDSKTTIIAEDD
ncbi:hypothetical protein BJV82DRAFT_673718 [Fennellomyces sp. T-0311]|nr:hypothetical protein BJV82DRAFT_673718 [Fennellomyces sp. T-0311]